MEAAENCLQIPDSSLSCLRKCSASCSRSPPRSRSGGISIGNTATRYNRSSRSVRSFDGLQQAVIGRRNHAHVDLDLARSADPKEPAGFQNPQQPHLQVAGHLGDLVQEQGAAVGALEHSGVIAHRPGKAPSLVTEQLRFDQGRCDRAAVDGDKGSVSAGAVLVHGAGGEFLAAAALADQHHAGMRRTDAADLLAHELHLRRVPQHGCKRCPTFQPTRCHFTYPACNFFTCIFNAHLVASQRRLLMRA